MSKPKMDIDVFHTEKYDKKVLDGVITEAFLVLGGAFNDAIDFCDDADNKKIIENDLNTLIEIGERYGIVRRLEKEKDEEHKYTMSRLDAMHNLIAHLDNQRA